MFPLYLVSFENDFILYFIQSYEQLLNQTLHIFSKDFWICLLTQLSIAKWTSSNDGQFMVSSIILKHYSAGT